MGFVLLLAVLGQITSYVDDQGTTHYVQSPTEVPARYRKRQKPLSETISEVKAEPQAEKDQQARATTPRPLPPARRGPTPDEVPWVPRPRPAAVSPDEEQRRAREAANARDRDLRSKPAHVQQTCIGSRCYTQITITGTGAKAGSTCATANNACTVGAECCSGRCSANLQCE